MIKTILILLVPFLFIDCSVKPEKINKKETINFHGCTSHWVARESK